LVLAPSSPHRASRSAIATRGAATSPSWRVARTGSGSHQPQVPRIPSVSATPQPTMNPAWTLPSSHPNPRATRDPKCLPPSASSRGRSVSTPAIAQTDLSSPAATLRRALYLLAAVCRPGQASPVGQTTRVPDRTCAQPDSLASIRPRTDPPTARTCDERSTCASESKPDTRPPIR
jgi:hypothetical protein